MPNFLGWFIGIIVGIVLVVVLFFSFSLPIPAVIPAAVATNINDIFGTFSKPNAIILLVACYLWAYILATTSISEKLPPVKLPLPMDVRVPGGAPEALPDIAGELFARGFMIGMTAALNTALIGLLPAAGPFLAPWTFMILSLAAIIPVARSRVFHGFLGWAAWLFPMSYAATGFGLLLFLINAPVAVAVKGIAAFRIDWTTGVLETTGGLTGITGFTGGFSLGNFTFIADATGGGSFTASSLSSHETGHSLNTAALGGIVLWINAIDENIPPFGRRNLAYGELTAESHAQVQPGQPHPGFFVRLWG